MSDVILRVNDLRVYYHTGSGLVRAVEAVTFKVRKGQSLGLVGESGSGKSTTALAIMRLLNPPGQIDGGEILLDGIDLTKLSSEEIRQARFSQVALIPQGAMNSLNPVMRIREQFLDTMAAHDQSLGRKQGDERIISLLGQVGLRPEVAHMYPHELSGGMKQRVCIALAVALKPQLIIADEPTSALDVVVQRQVMETLKRVQAMLQAAVILVGHDMGLMAQFVDHLGVMYAGKLVEVGPIKEIFQAPQHPYTTMLIESLPSLDGKRVFKGIPGVSPSLLDPPPGCAFHLRCRMAIDRCSTDEPVLRETQPDRWVSCHLSEVRP